MYLTALQNSTIEEETILKNYYQKSSEIHKIKNVTQFFIDKNIPELAHKSIENYTELAFTFIEKLALSSEKKKILKDLGINLMNRSV